MTLLEVYTQYGFPGAERFYKISKKEGLGFTRKEIAEFLSHQDVAQLHRRPVPGKSHPISSPSFGFSYMVDLLDVTPYSKANGGTHWLVLMIDIFSRKLAIEPIPNKKASSVLVGIKRCVTAMGKIPTMMQSDKGSEWKDSVQKWYDSEGIVTKQADVGDHRSLGIIDSASRLVKNWIHRHITHTQQNKFIDAIPTFVSAYNRTPHTSLGGLTPNQAIKYPWEVQRYRFEKRVQKKKYERKEKTFDVGDHVRVLKNKETFDRGYHVKYSLTVYQVVSVKGLYYTLDNGKSYRADRLLKVPAPTPDASVAPPKEDIAKKARFERRTDVLLQSEGIDPKNTPPLRRSTRERRPRGLLVDEEYGNIFY